MLSEQKRCEMFIMRINLLVRRRCNPQVHEFRLLGVTAVNSCSPCGSLALRRVGDATADDDGAGVLMLPSPC